MKDRQNRLNQSADIKAVGGGFWKVHRVAKLVAGLGAIALGTSAMAANPTAKQALGLKPVQPGVQYAIVAADEVEQCQVVDVSEEGAKGWLVIGPDGNRLRRFLDTNNDQRIDRWSYFQYGVEVYRDVDSNYDEKADRYCWMGSQGIRVGIDTDQNGKIDRWERISAEEVSAEVVGALAANDSSRFMRLLITADELKRLGLGREHAEKVAQSVQQARTGFAGLASGAGKLQPNAKWLQFAAPSPGVIPAGEGGATSDVIVYENVIAMLEEQGQSKELLVGTMVRVNDTWKLIGLPAVGNGEQLANASAGMFFSASAASLPTPSGAADGLQEAVEQLEELDQKMATAPVAQKAELHAERAKLVASLVRQSANEQDRESWTRQLVDTLSVAIQSGEYPGGLKQLQAVAKQIDADGRPTMAAYAQYQAIQSEYATRPAAEENFAEGQKWLTDTLTAFVKQYPKSQYAAQAMMQLALNKEFQGSEKDAVALYRQVATGFPNIDAGRKAKGAIYRMESVGRQVELAGTTIDGKSFKLSALRGRPVVLHYWATWCDQCLHDVKLLDRLKARYKNAGLTIIGVNVDSNRADAQAYLKANPVPWPQLYAEGGLEGSPLSQAFGVQTLPNMLLIDAKGVLVGHGIRASALDGAIDGATRK